MVGVSTAVILSMFCAACSSDQFLRWPEFRTSLEQMGQDLPNHEYASGRAYVVAARKRIEVELRRMNDCAYGETAVCGRSEYLRGQITEYHIGSTMLEFIIEWTDDEQPSCKSLRHNIKYTSNYRPNLLNPNADFALRLGEKICRLDSARPLEQTLTTMKPGFIDIEFADAVARDGYVFPDFLTMDVIDAARLGQVESLERVRGIESEPYGEAVLPLLLNQVGPGNFLEMLDNLQRIGSDVVWEQAIEDLGRRDRYSAGGFESTYLQYYELANPELNVRFALLMAWLKGPGPFWTEWLERVIDDSLESLVPNPEFLIAALEGDSPILSILNDAEISAEESEFLLTSVPIAQLEQSMILFSPENLRPRLVALTAEVAYTRGLEPPHLWRASDVRSETKAAQF